MALRQFIGKKSLFFVTLNSILGTGIFFLPAIGAYYSGYASILSWLIMGVVAIFISLYFGELVSMFPKSGGVYEYTKHAFGEFPSFLMGWIGWMVTNITIAMLIVGSIVYVLPGQPLAVNMALAAAAIIVFNLVSYRGISFSSAMLVFFGIMTLASLAILIVPGLPSADISVFFSGSIEPVLVLLTVYFIAETFFGWETTTYLAEEVKSARKVLPKMLVITTAAIVAMSVFLVFVALGNVDPATFGRQTAPLSFFAAHLFGRDVAAVYTLIVFIPLIGTAASWIVSSPRLLYAMSRDRVLPSFFLRIHKKHQTPKNAIIFQTVVSVLITFVALGEFHLLLSLLVPLVVIMYSFVMLSVVKLRVKAPKAQRPFRAPFGRAGPVAVTAFLVALLVVWLAEVGDALPIFILGLLLVVLGIPLYVVIKLQTDETFTRKFFDRVSFFWDRAFSLWYTENDVKRVVSRLKIRSDSVVLDFGCGSGITTVALAKKAKKGMVVALDISEKQLEHAVNKVKAMGLSNVILVREDRLRLGKNSFDAIAAVGVIEYLDKPRESVKKMMNYLKPGGTFSFLSFGKSLGIAAPSHLSSEAEIRKLFSGLDVDVNILREKKKLTEYWHIWGRKKRAK